MSAPEVIANHDRAAEIVGGQEMLNRMRAAGWVQPLKCSTRKTLLFSVEALIVCACRLLKDDIPPELPARLKAKNTLAANPPQDADTT